MKVTKELLADLFRKAEAAALAADPGDGLQNDGGTCNFDTPVLRLPRVRAVVVEAAAAEAGVNVSRSSWLGGPAWFIGVTTKGQADRRTKMAEAAYRVLKAAEIPGVLHASFYQQMD